MCECAVAYINRRCVSASLLRAAARFQAASHVQFNIARVRMLANIIAFLPERNTTLERTELLGLLDAELADLRSEYFAMLYGGQLKISVSARGLG